MTIRRIYLFSVPIFILFNFLCILKGPTTKVFERKDGKERFFLLFLNKVNFFEIFERTKYGKMCPQQSPRHPTLPEALDSDSKNYERIVLNNLYRPFFEIWLPGK